MRLLANAPRKTAKVRFCFFYFRIFLLQRFEEFLCCMVSNLDKKNFFLLNVINYVKITGELDSANAQK